MNFASDNAGPAHPRVMQALIEANEGYALPYGAEAAMERVRARIREVFEAPEAAVYLVATGTAANALLLATMTKPWQTIYCAACAHIHEDECGAPEFFAGAAKLTLVDSPEGKIDPDALARAIAATGEGDVHGVQRGPLSLTNLTERGTLYTPKEIAGLTAIAKAQGLPTHLDGARFANAVAAQGCSPAEMSWKAGIDAVSFGGTKNGLLGVEAAVIFDPALAWEFELRRKRGAHLFSKHRFLSAQMEAYLEGDLWLEMAGSANRAAAALAEGLVRDPGTRLLHAPQGNMIFASLPAAAHDRLQAAGARYAATPSADGVTARLVCDWSARAEDRARFLGLLAG